MRDHSHRGGCHRHGVVLAAWLVGTSKAARSGFYFRPRVVRLPVGVQLLVALAGLTLCLAVSPSLWSLLTNRQYLIRLNVWRLGRVFVALMFTRQVPALYFSRRDWAMSRS
jgi:hypothetical protein